MKKILFTIIIILAIITACGIPEQSNVDAAIPAGYEIISKTENGSNMKQGYFVLYEVKHKETKCYSTIAIGSEGIAITPILKPAVNNLGSQPYCDN